MGGSSLEHGGLNTGWGGDWGFAVRAYDYTPPVTWNTSLTVSFKTSPTENQPNTILCIHSNLYFYNFKAEKILTKPCECVWPPGGRLQSSCRATNISASLCLEIQNTCVYSCNRLSNRCFFLNIWSQCMYFHQWCSPALWKTCDFWGIRQIDRIPWWSWASACSNPSQPLLLLGLLALIREQEHDGDCGDAVGDGGVQPPQLILHHELMGLLSQQCWLIKNK